jgi:6-phosphofructokinase 2
MARIVTLTPNPALDVATSTDEVTPEHKLRCTQMLLDPGGGGLNVARVVHELAGQSLAIYPRGGPTGDILSQLLGEKGVSSRALPVAGLTRQSFTVAETLTGREYRFVLPGHTLAQAEWQALLTALEEEARGAGCVVLSGSLPPGVPEDFYAQAALAMRRLGVRVAVDTSGAPLARALEAGVFLAKPNRREFEALTGLSGADVPALAAAARDFVQRGRVEVLVLSLGAGGALLTTADVQLRATPPPVEAKSSVGAGDSFVAGMVHSLMRGEAPQEAFRWAVASGTAALLTPGTELCRREDVERLRGQVRVVPVVAG